MTDRAPVKTVGPVSRTVSVNALIVTPATDYPCGHWPPASLHGSTDPFHLFRVPVLDRFGKRAECVVTRQRNRRRAARTSVGLPLLALLALGVRDFASPQLRHNDARCVRQRIDEITPDDSIRIHLRGLADDTLPDGIVGQLWRHTLQTAPREFPLQLANHRNHRSECLLLGFDP